MRRTPAQRIPVEAASVNSLFRRATGAHAPARRQQEGRQLVNLTKSTIVTQEMLDLAEVTSSSFRVPTVGSQNLLTGSFFAETKNTAPSAVPTPATQGNPATNANLAWNGVTRLLITPASTVMRLPDTQGALQEISGKTLKFSKINVTTSSIVLSEKKTTIDKPNSFDAKDSAEFLFAQGGSYVIASLVADDLKAELETTFGSAGKADVLFNALLQSDGNGTWSYKTQSGDSLLGQSTANFFAQYDGTYAAQAAEYKVEPMSEACLVGGELKRVVMLTFAGDAGSRTATATVESAASVAIPTAEEVANGTKAFPVFAMVRIDVPEDLVGTVYASVLSTDATKVDVAVVNMGLSVGVAVEATEVTTP